jgi:hypothetical protein
MKMLWEFNAKVGREDIFKPTIGNESLHEISNDNGVRVVNFAKSKNLTVKIRFFHIVSIVHVFMWIQLRASATHDHRQIYDD